MDSRNQNYISMIAACLKVAQDSLHKAVWEGQEPADFGSDLVLLTNGRIARESCAMGASHGWSRRR